MSEQFIPSVLSDLRQDIVQMPEVIKECSGIRIYGRRIRSVLFTTDVSIIANHNADAILAVYPFTAQSSYYQKYYVGCVSSSLGWCWWRLDDRYAFS